MLVIIIWNSIQTECTFLLAEELTETNFETWIISA